MLSWLGLGLRLRVWIQRIIGKWSHDGGDELFYSELSEYCKDYGCKKGNDEASGEEGDAPERKSFWQVFVGSDDEPGNREYQSTNAERQANHYS